MTRVPVGVLVSGSGTNLQALLDACAAPAFPARIAVVLSDVPTAHALERARRAGVPTEVLPRRGRGDRNAYDAELASILRAHGVEWVCLAGFLRILGPAFLDAFPGRILNVHPALLPAFPGLHAQGQAHAHGVCVAGATIHLVDSGTDTGPIVAQGAVAALQDDTADDLQARILAMEHRLYPMALRWAVEGRISVEGRRVRVALASGETRTLFG